MKPFALMMAGLFALILLATPFCAAEPFEDALPFQSDMKLTFIPIVAHFEQPDHPWTISVTKGTYPDTVFYGWSRPQKDGVIWTGNRILTDLRFSRDFNPFFKRDEHKSTKDTAPWLSLQIMKELREVGLADNFREGGTGAVNWAAVTLTVKEKVIFPVYINGKAEALHALRLSKGIVVWNNIHNPLVLEYEPLGVPLFTSITGWKVTKLNY
jgi:hypothetical protein